MATYSKSLLLAVPRVYVQSDQEATKYYRKQFTVKHGSFRLYLENHNSK